MIVPTPYTAGLKTLVVGDPNTYGDRPKSWTDPVDLPVHWAAPGAMADLEVPGRNASRIRWTLCSPSPCPVTEHDRIVWDGEEFAVSGRPKDWAAFGPWDNPVAAVLIELERLEG